MKSKLIVIIIIFISMGYEVSGQCGVQCEGGNNNGTNASNIGTNNIAEGNSSFAGGKDSEAIGKQSFAFGNLVQAKSLYSIAMGKDVTTWGGNSVGIGNDLITTTTSAMVIGKGFDYDQNRLKNDIPYSLMIGFNSSKPTLFVSESKSGMNSTGRIGIGNVTSPQAKLHIREDANYDTASVYIQASNIERPAFLWLGTKNFGMQKQSASLQFLTGDYYEFNDGNVGIGISEPREKLEVDGNVKVMDRYRLETTQVRSSSREGLKLFTSMGSGIFIDERGQVGIGNTRPGATLDVTGKIKTYSLQIPGTNPIDSLRDLTNYVLKSKDDYGNVIWAPQSSLDDGDWSTAQTGDLYFNAGKVGIGTDDPVEKFQIGDRWTFHNGGGPKIIGYNFFWDGGAKRIVQDYVSIIKLDSEGDIEFKTAAQGGGGTPIEEWTDVLTLKNNGKVGIGVMDPDNELEVLGTVSAQTIDVENFRMKANGYGAGRFLQSDDQGVASWVSAPEPGDDDWQMSGLDIFRTSGHVGIGTDTPGYPLHIVSPADNYHCGSETFMKIEDGADNNPGDYLGYIEFGRLPSSGSFIKQRSGLCYDGENYEPNINPTCKCSFVTI